jgi:membrane fusion protein (multidrug efflux system)
LRDRYADKGGTAAVVIKIKLPTGQTYDQDGHIDYIDPTVSANTDTLLLRAKIANPVRPGLQSSDPSARELVDGEFVTVLVQAVDPIQTLAIPQTALLSDQQGNYVWVVGANNVAQQRRVTLGQPSGTLATIVSGLQDGETVVSDGVQRVRPNQPVNPAPAAPGPGGAAGPPGGVAPAGGK